MYTIILLWLTHIIYLYFNKKTQKFAFAEYSYLSEHTRTIKCQNAADHRSKKIMQGSEIQQSIK